MCSARHILGAWWVVIANDAQDPILVGADWLILAVVGAASLREFGSCGGEDLGLEYSSRFERRTVLTLRFSNELRESMCDVFGSFRNVWAGSCRFVGCDRQ